jgi:hypothetical protein
VRHVLLCSDLPHAPIVSRPDLLLTPVYGVLPSVAPLVCRTDSFILQWWLFVSFFMLCTEVLGLCSDEPFPNWDNGIVQRWKIIWSFHYSCYLHWFCGDTVILAEQFSFACVVLFLLAATFCVFVTDHNSIVYDVFNPYNLLVVVLLSTPHCRWCIYSAQIQSLVAAMGAVPLLRFATDLSSLFFPLYVLVLSFCYIN